MRVAVSAVSLALAVGCDGGMMMMMQPTPPQVFLTAPETNVVGTSFDVTVNVSGCAKVDQLQLEENKTLIKTANFKGANTRITVLPGEVAKFFGTHGIAADLAVTARAICDDGRENRSPPVGIKFFPVASVLAPANGMAIVLPDSFVAQGGTSGTPVTFIGCASTDQGLSLVKVDLMGNVIGINATLPFPCDYYASISERVGGNLRWIFEPGRGVFAFDDVTLNVTGGILGDSYAVFAAGPDGDGIIWDNAAGTGNAVGKVRRNGGTAEPNNLAWTSPVPGVVNGQPVFDLSSGTVMIPSWRAPLGQMTGNQTVQTVNYVTGNRVGELVLVTQSYAFLDATDPPNVAFSPDGRTLYIPFQAQGGAMQSGIMACGTQGSGTGCTPRWRSPLLDGVIRYVIPFAAGTKIAAISENKVWFIEESSLISAGTVLNPSGIPTAASGSLLISGVQPGLGQDFYLLNGAPFATEIIAFDTPDNEEIYRYSTEGGGGTAQTAITMAIDDVGQPWLRIGVNQVKPLALSEYRNVRGPTIPTP